MVYYEILWVLMAINLLLLAIFVQQVDQAYCTKAQRSEGPNNKAPMSKAPCYKAPCSKTPDFKGPKQMFCQYSESKIDVMCSMQ